MLAAADLYVRNVEVRQLVTAAEAAADAIGQWETSRHQIMSDLPGEFYVTREQRQDAERRLQREAADATTSLTDAVARLRDVGVTVPWHGDIVRARDRYLDHANAWIARLQLLTRDPSALQEPAPRIATTRSASEDAFRAALPLVALQGLDDRVEALFDGQPPAG